MLSNLASLIFFPFSCPLYCLCPYAFVLMCMINKMHYLYIWGLANDRLHSLCRFLHILIPLLFLYELCIYALCIVIYLFFKYFLMYLAICFVWMFVLSSFCIMKFLITCFLVNFIRVVEINELEQELEFSFCKFLKILMVSDKTIYKAFRIHKSL